MPKKLTPNQQEWNRQVNRIKNFIRNAQKRGFRFDDSLIPTKSKVITKKRLQEIKSLTPQKLYREATYIDPFTGIIMSGIERRTQERKIAARKAAETRKVRKANRAQRAGPQLDIPVEAESDEDLPLYTDLVLQQVEDMINSWEPPSTWSEWFAETKRRDRNTLKSMLDGAISSDGRDAVAKRCEENATTIIGLTERILYDSGKNIRDKSGRIIVENMLVYINEFSAIIMGRPLTVEESAQYADWQESSETDY